MFNSIILFLLLFGTWLVLSGFFSNFFIGLGVVSCLLAVFVSRRMENGAPIVGDVVGFMLRIPFYLLWLMKEIVVSAMDVTCRVWKIDMDISPEMAWVPTGVSGDLGVTVLGNSITMTPGTVTCAVRGDGLMQVHALTGDAMKDVRSGEMASRVANLVGIKRAV